VPELHGMTEENYYQVSSPAQNQIGYILNKSHVPTETRSFWKWWERTVVAHCRSMRLSHIWRNITEKAHEDFQDSRSFGREPNHGFPKHETRVSTVAFPPSGSSSAFRRFRGFHLMSRRIVTF
jgi:hypothetical protein